LQASSLQHVLSPSVDSLTYSKWHFDNCQAQLLTQYQNTTIHQRQKAPRLEKGQSKMTPKAAHDILSHQNIWI